MTLADKRKVIEVQHAAFEAYSPVERELNFFESSPTLRREWFGTR